MQLVTQSLILALVFFLYCPVTIANEHYGFELTHSSGKDINDSHWSGQYLLVSFGYSHCPDVCPLTLWRIKNALAELDDISQIITPLFISIDPYRDTPAHLNSYIKHFHPHQQGLTGTKEQLDKVAKTFHMTYGYKVKGRKIPYPTDEQYEVYHSSHIYFLSPERELLDVFGYGLDSARMAVKIRDILLRQQR